MASSKGESQPLLKSGADVKPVYCVPRQGSIGNAADVSCHARAPGPRLCQNVPWARAAFDGARPRAHVSALSLEGVCGGDGCLVPWLCGQC